MKPLSNIAKAPVRCRGFTLVEIAIATTISTLIVIASLGFLLEATRATMRTQNNSQNDLTEWGIYSGITIDSRVANGLNIYKDFTAASFNALADQISDKANTVTGLGNRGDFLVLSKSTQPDDNTPAKFLSLTGYVFDPGSPIDGGKGTFKKFVYSVPTAEQGNTLEAILTAHYASFVLITVANGLDAVITDGAPSAAQKRAFLYRDVKLHSAVLNLQVRNGFTGTRTDNAKLIETAFFIRI